MELRDIRSFIAVAEELHFARAAARLHLSPPPLTQRIKSLERELGVSLLTRSNRSVALTAAGVALLEEGRRLVEDAGRIADVVRRADRGESGQLRAGVSGSAIFSQARVLQALLTRSLPEVRLVWHELSSLEQLDLLEQNRLDLALVSTIEPRADIVVAHSVREPMVVALPATHRLAKKRNASLSLASLRHEVFILGHRHLSPASYDRVIAACQAAGFSPIVDHQAGHLMTYLSLVAIGAGVSLVPASMAHAGMAGVRFVPLARKPPWSEVYLAWNRKTQSPIVPRVLKLYDLARRALK